MIGGLAKGILEANAFVSAFFGLQASQGFLLTPHLLDLTAWDFSGHYGVGSVDSARCGDILADRWNVYAFGEFPLELFMNSLPSNTPTTLGERYATCGLEAQVGEEGFRHILDIPFSIGKEIRVNAPERRWFFSRESMYPCIPAKHSFDYGWRWPVVQSTRNVPTIGQRLDILGGLPCLDNPRICDDGFANDALWRMTPTTVLRHACLCAASVFSSRIDNRVSLSGPRNFPPTPAGRTYTPSR